MSVFSFHNDTNVTRTMGWYHAAGRYVVCQVCQVSFSGLHWFHTGRTYDHPSVFLCFTRRLELAAQLKQWHLKVIEIVKRGQHRKSLDKLFQGFKPAVESCYFNWEVAYPLPGITYCSTDKKSASFGWARAVQPQRGPKVGTSGEPLEPGGGGGGRGGGSESGAPEHKMRVSHPPQQEVAVRPKETIVSKRKAMSGVNSGGMLVRLGGGMSLSLDENAKGVYKACSSSLSTSSKGKLMQSGKSSCGSSNAAGGKHPSAKRRTSSEDSSLEPDMAELSLDDGSSLALGAEASNTFEFLPPPPEMLPSPSSLLREPPRKYNNGSGGGNITKERTFEGKRGIHAAIPLVAEAPHCFPKESPMVAMAVEVEKEVDVEAELEENGGDEDRVEDALPSISAMVTAKPSRSRREGEGSNSVGMPGPQIPEAAAGGDPVGEDDYQAYYLSAASEEGAERGVPDSNLEEEPDIFAGIKPLEQEGRMEVRNFVRHGFLITIPCIMHNLWNALFKNICCV